MATQKMIGKFLEFCYEIGMEDRLIIEIFLSKVSNAFLNQRLKEIKEYMEK